jgi:endonuclease/exonuclease/phosphatase (EEP) superfamily protein YafD
VAAVLTAVLLVTQVPLYLGTSVPSGATNGLTVMTANIFKGNGDIDDIADAVDRLGVDLLAVQELTFDAEDRLDAALGAMLPYSATRPGAESSGNGLWSRFPLEPLPPPPGFEHPPVAATIDVEGRPIFVAGVHPQSPYPDDTARWSADLDELAEWLDEVDGPAVVAGDFNATFDHPQFRDVLASGFRDAAEQAGAGFLPTFPANRRRVPLLITIDHVLVNGGIVATEVRRVHFGHTDHAALVTILAVPTATRSAGV